MLYNNYKWSSVNSHSPPVTLGTVACDAVVLPKYINMRIYYSQ